MRKIVKTTILAMILTILLGFTLGPAYAALGDILRSFTPTPWGNGRGIAFDGTDLYYTFYGSPGFIYKVSTSASSFDIPL